MITLHLDDSVIKSLTNNELNILKFIYSHPEMILEMSIHEFARQVSYSTATIIRFCRKLGLSGFAELKYSLHQELKESRQTQIESDSLSIPMIMKNLFSDTEGTAKLIQEEQLYQVFLYCGHQEESQLFLSDILKSSYFLLDDKKFIKLILLN